MNVEQPDFVAHTPTGRTIVINRLDETSEVINLRRVSSLEHLDGKHRNGRRAFEDRHASTQAYIDTMRPRCVELASVLKKTGSFYCHCDWHHRYGNGGRTLGTD